MISKTLLLILIISTFGFTTFAQTKKEQAYEKAIKSLKHTKNGEYSKSIELLKEAVKLDPEHILYPYELALAHTYNEEYEKSIKILNKLLKHKDVYDQIFQLMGINYSYLKKPDKAIEYFDKGIEKFPNSGILHLERGNMEMMADRYEEALFYYENGIKVAPSFPSNYYWASRIFCNSTEEVWGLIYGEIFMNLERNSRRTAEISKLLFDTYVSEIEISSDTTMRVSFCQNMTININEVSEGKNLQMPFCLIYEPTLLLSVASENEINIQSLNRIRFNFIQNYFDLGHDSTHPNVLFEYNKRLLEAGHLETYNYWILMKGDEAGFDKWFTNNEDKWNEFVEWFTNNPLNIDESNCFHRSQY